MVPRYRVPFFEALSRRVDLLVIASEDRIVEGVTDVRDCLPFACARLAEEPGTRLHPELNRCLREHRAQVWISGSHAIERYAWGQKTMATVREHDIRRVYWGCGGYAVRDFAACRRLQNQPLRKPRTYLEWRRRRERWRGLDGHILYSSHSADYLQAVYDVPRERMTVAHNAVDTRLTEDVRRRRESTGVARDLRRLVFVGRMTEGKGVKTLLRSFAEVSRRRPDISLHLVGDGGERPALERQAREMGLDGVSFLGAVYDEQQLAEILCDASLFVLPGLGGLALNTAMAAGLPIVCSQGDGTELDLITEGVNGWHVPPGDVKALSTTLTEALSDPGRLHEMGMTSAERIETRFNLAAMVDSYVRGIEAALAPTARPPGN